MHIAALVSKVCFYKGLKSATWVQSVLLAERVRAGRASDTVILRWIVSIVICIAFDDTHETP